MQRRNDHALSCDEHLCAAAHCPGAWRGGVGVGYPGQTLSGRAFGHRSQHAGPCASEAGRRTDRSGGQADPHVQSVSDSPTGAVGRPFMRLGQHGHGVFLQLGAGSQRSGDQAGAFARSQQRDRPSGNRGVRAGVSWALAGHALGHRQSQSAKRLRAAGRRFRARAAERRLGLAKRGRDAPQCRGGIHRGDSGRGRHSTGAR